VDRETLERLVVRLFGIAQRCADQSSRHQLLGIANELVDLIEGQKQDKKSRSSNSRFSPRKMTNSGETNASMSFSTETTQTLT
jgi:hypothetical protein